MTDDAAVDGAALSEVDSDDETAPADAPRATRVTGWVVMAIAAAIVVADQLTKHWAVSTLPDRDGPIEVFWTLQWNLSFNTGMAFSQGDGDGIGPYIGALALIIVMFLGVSLRKIDSGVARVAGALIVGGALGNIIDRLFRGDGWLHGAVVDFIDFQWFPIFNIADSGVTCGGVLFVLWSLFGQRAAPDASAVAQASG